MGPLSPLRPQRDPSGSPSGLVHTYSTCGAHNTSAATRQTPNRPPGQSTPTQPVGPMILYHSESALQPTRLQTSLRACTLLANLWGSRYLSKSTNQPPPLPLGQSTPTQPVGPMISYHSDSALQPARFQNSLRACPGVALLANRWQVWGSQYLSKTAASTSLQTTSGPVHTFPTCGAHDVMLSQHCNQPNFELPSGPVHSFPTCGAHDN
jgi:hypothetical protein